ncbi:MAG: hypothetical protein ACK5JD_01700 [Mangrovibacterium sp.]
MAVFLWCFVPLSVPLSVPLTIFYKNGCFHNYGAKWAVFGRQNRGRKVLPMQVGLGMFAPAYQPRKWPPLLGFRLACKHKKSPRRSWRRYLLAHYAGPPVVIGV